MTQSVYTAVYVQTGTTVYIKDGAVPLLTAVHTGTAYTPGTLQQCSE